MSKRMKITKNNIHIRDLINLTILLTSYTCTQLLKTSKQWNPQEDGKGSLKEIKGLPLLLIP